MIDGQHVARALTAIILVLCVIKILAADETVQNSDYGFTLTVPEGFRPNAEIAAAAPRILHAFVRGDPNDDQLDVMLIIEKMRRTIGREPLKPEDLPPGFQGRLFTTKWQGFDVEAFEVPEQLGEINTVTYNVQIPLKPVAIQVKLFGPADRKVELKSLLATILNGLHGESNWRPSLAPAVLDSSTYYTYVLMGFAVFFILGGLVALWVISKIAPKGTVLAIAGAIYVASWGLDNVRIREITLLVGAMRMLGFAGGLLGIIELVRNRNPRPPT